jgi:hypothetical protein
MKKKYLNFKPLSQVKEYFPFWRGFMKITDEFFERGSPSGMVRKLACGKILG